MTFHDYYSDFMGRSFEEKLMSSSKYRSLPIHKKYYYPIIFTDYFDHLFCSSSQEFYDVCYKFFNGTYPSVEKIKKALPGKFDQRKFYRYSYDISQQLKSDAIPLSRQLMQSLDFDDTFNIEDYVKNNKKLFDEKRQFVLIEENKVATRALVSDLYAGGGNIVVYTYPEYRNKGYAKQAVKACINWCLSRNVLPIYFVETSNQPSITVAEDLGFTRKCQEIMLQRLD